MDELERAAGFSDDYDVLILSLDSGDALPIDFQEQAQCYDQTRESSPRSKPPEQVLGLWFNPWAHTP